MSLSGNEILFVQGLDGANRPAGPLEQTTTSAIAALANVTALPPVSNTSITTVGNGTLTAAALVSGIITRTGPTAAYTDTTDTAVNIVAGLTAYVANESSFVQIKNATAYVQTIAAGSGVTLSGIVAIPAYSVGIYLMTINSTSAVTLLHVKSEPIEVNALKVVTAQTDVTSSTSLTAITGLSAPLIAGSTYAVHCYLPVTCTATPGAKFALASDGTLSATSFSCAGTLFNATTPSASSVTTTLGNAVASVAAAGTYAVLDAVIVVNVAGSIVAQIAQNTSNGTATSALVNGYMQVTRLA
jgi:hypothetical protein